MLVAWTARRIPACSPPVSGSGPVVRAQVSDIALMLTTLNWIPVDSIERENEKTARYDAKCLSRPTVRALMKGG